MCLSLTPMSPANILVFLIGGGHERHTPPPPQEASWGMHQLKKSKVVAIPISHDGANIPLGPCPCPNFSIWPSFLMSSTSLEWQSGLHCSWQSLQLGVANMAISFSLDVSAPLLLLDSFCLIRHLPLPRIHSIVYRRWCCYYVIETICNGSLYIIP